MLLLLMLEIFNVKFEKKVIHIIFVKKVEDDEIQNILKVVNMSSMVVNGGQVELGNSIFKNRKNKYNLNISFQVILDAN